MVLDEIPDDVDHDVGLAAWAVVTNGEVFDTSTPAATRNHGRVGKRLADIEVQRARLRERAVPTPHNEVARSSRANRSDSRNRGRRSRIAERPTRARENRSRTR